jgi:hypothetical protein
MRARFRKQDRALATPPPSSLTATSSTTTTKQRQGVEGVDYHLGSVEDLDPSEWQVCVLVGVSGHAGRLRLIFSSLRFWTRPLPSFGTKPSHTHKTHTHTHTQVQPHCIPVHANVTTYDWSRLTTACPGGFDVIMMDPPWQLATANPTRGVALGYSQLTDADITALPIPALQANGFLFIWVINAKYKFALDLFANWGYELGCFFFFFFSFAGGALVALYCMRAWCEPGPPAPSIVSFSLTPACRISSSYSSKTFQAGRRDRVGEDHGQPAPGQVARLLPAARQGSLPGRAEGCGPARRSHVRGRRRHLRRAPGPIPETGGDLPAGRGARAQW